MYREYYKYQIDSLELTHAINIVNIVACVDHAVLFSILIFFIKWNTTWILLLINAPILAYNAKSFEYQTCFIDQQIIVS